MPEFISTLNTQWGPLIVWILGLGVVLCIVWDSLRLGISPMPSSKKVFEAVKEHLPELEEGEVCELGAGWGGVAYKLAKHYPKHRVAAYENAVISWLALKLRFSRHPRVNVHRDNFLKSPLPQARLYYTYLYPGGMKALAKKIELECQHDCIWVSFTFALPGHKPIKTLTLSDLYRSKIYFYEINAMKSA